MWSWANDSLEEKIKASSRKVKQMGEELGLLKLSSVIWGAEEYDGWEMTSVLAKSLGALDAYRTADDESETYMVVQRGGYIKRYNRSYRV